MSYLNELGQLISFDELLRVYNIIAKVLFLLLIYIFSPQKKESLPNISSNKN